MRNYYHTTMVDEKSKPVALWSARETAGPLPLLTFVVSGVGHKQRFGHVLSFSYTASRSLAQ